MNSPVNNERRRSGGGDTWRTAESAQRENESWRNSVESGGQHLRSPDIGEKKPELRGSGVASGLAEVRPDDRGSRMEDRGSRMEDRARMEDRGSRMEDRSLRMESSRFSPPRLRNRSTTPDEEDSTSFHETYEREMVRRRRGKKSPNKSCFQKEIWFRTKAERFLLVPVLWSVGLSWSFHPLRGWIDHLCLKQVPPVLHHPEPNI